jgi:hypothetical protein
VRQSQRSVIRHVLLWMTLFSIGWGQETRIQNFTVSFLGLPVMKLERMIQTDSLMTTVSYDTKPYSRYLESIVDVANYYWVQFNNDNYSPVTWGKKTHEFSWDQEYRVTTDTTGQIFYPDSKTIESSKPYFSLFSAVAYVEDLKPQEKITINVLIEGRFFNVRVSPKEFDKDARRYDVEFMDFVGTNIFEKTDILLTKLSNNGTILSLWVHPEKGIIKTQFGKSPMSVDVRRN